MAMGVSKTRTVEESGGTVRVASQPSGGPYWDPLKKHILLISDDRQTLEKLELALISLGCTVQTSRDGAGALEFLRRGTFTGVMLDIDTPSRGQDMLREIRNLDGALPIITLSGVADVEEAATCFKAGAQEYLVKPIVLDALKRAVGRWSGGVE
jgi:two-component system capsular synthesis sensor histidine kinase RcsC